LNAIAILLLKSQFRSIAGESLGSGFQEMDYKTRLSSTYLEFPQKSDVSCFAWIGRQCGPVPSGFTRSTQPGGAQNRVCGLLRRQGIDSNRDMGSAIERETAQVTASQVGLVGEDGPNLLRAAASGKSGGKLDLKVDEHRAGSGKK
jgi:hypothetical protein